MHVCIINKTGKDVALLCADMNAAICLTSLLYLYCAYYAVVSWLASICVSLASFVGVLILMSSNIDL